MTLFFFGFLLISAALLFWAWRRRWIPIKRQDLGQEISVPDLQSDQEFATYSFQKQNVCGVDIAYIDVGRGRPFVLIHGLGASSFCYRFLIPLLKSRGRVIAIDLPGFGQSQKSNTIAYDVESQVDRLAAFFDALGIKDTVVVGSSMGGLLCLHLAKRRPDLVAEQILLSPALFVPTYFPQSLLIAGRLVLGRFLNEVTLVHFLKRVIVRHQLIDEFMIKNYLEPLQQEFAPYALLESLRSISNPKWSRTLQGMAGSPLILWGQHDKVLPVALVRKISQVFPNAKIKIHPDGGHHIQEDDPVWVSEKFFEHLNKRP